MFKTSFKYIKNTVKIKTFLRLIIIYLIDSYHIKILIISDRYDHIQKFLVFFNPFCSYMSFFEDKVSPKFQHALIKIPSQSL